ncbi:hypothetical protein B6U99_02655 [Candidatus Geothermarchaeota archaeon ex4572_27]|nr:MAG: hypothetical protein B6U99_02655 [Candidatus Geothermarchaeota archaeon ex4572_27]
MQEAAWPMQSRLNGRIYLWVWRSGNDTVSWVVSDGYMLSEGPASLYFAGNLSFRRSVTIELVVRKFVEGGEGALTAFLVYNKVDSSGEVYEDYRPATLDYGFNALFYATLAMFICTVVGHITARVLRKEAELRAARARRGWHKKG